MKLSEVYAKPIKEVLETMKMVDLKFHTDDAGNVHTVEVKYSGDNEETDAAETGAGAAKTAFRFP